MPFEQRFEFDALTRAECEALGEPGQRHFRLVFGTDLECVILWLEKQQAQALGMAFEQMLAQLRVNGIKAARVQPHEPMPYAPIPAGAAEMQVGRLAVSFDEASELVTVYAFDIADDDEEEDDRARFQGTLTLQQAATLAGQIETVASAGRPVCPRCNAPIGPNGHVCPHDNGHFPIDVTI